jgi:gamma-glutamyltranspeptidase/glutathione hydrolase
MYLNSDGKGEVSRSQVGALAVAIPGEPRGLAELLKQHGSLSPKQVAKPAIRLARRGFPAGHHLAAALNRTQHAEVTATVANGAEVAAGQVIRRPELASTISRWARSGGESMNTGSDAELIAAEAAPTLDDLASYEPKQRDPIVVQFRGYTVITMPPPSSGGVVLGQILQVLEKRDLRGLGHNSSAYLHVLIESMKHAYADRAHHMGDPDFTHVDTGRLLSKERVGEVIAAFDPDRTLPTDAYGERIAPPSDAGTEHISVVDRDGMAVALTTTINTSFGSGVVIEPLGIIMNNEMDDFSVQPGVPNAFGLIGTVANEVMPGKRPLSSMSPTVVLDGDGDVVMTVGASGGSLIISGTLQVLLNVLVFDMDAAEAVSAPRVHHQWVPEFAWLEPDVPVDVRSALEARGHDFADRGFHYSSVQAVVVTETGLEAASDPRKGGWPAASTP